MKSQKISLLNVIQNLKHGEIAIEFADIKENDGNTYYALLIQSNDSVPSIIRICTEKDLEKTSIDDIQNGNLYKLIWSPLENILDSCKTIFFSINVLPSIDKSCFLYDFFFLIISSALNGYSSSFIFT